MNLELSVHDDPTMVAGEKVIDRKLEPDQQLPPIRAELLLSVIDLQESGIDSLTASSLSSSSSSTSSGARRTSSSLSSSASLSSSDDDNRRTPDGGWGWMIVFASFVISFLTDGLTYTTSIFYEKFLRIYGESET